MKAVYRVIAALAAAAAVPALYFLKLVHITIDLGFMDGYFDDEFSIQDFAKFFSDKQKSFSLPHLSPTVASTLAPLKVSAIVTAVFLAIMLVMIVAAIVCPAFTNARKVNLTFSLVGAVSAFGAMAAFNHMTSIIINGTVSLGTIANAFLADTGSTLGSLASAFGLGSAVSAVGELLLLRLGSAIVTVLIIFIFIAMWTAAFMLVDMDSDGAAIKKASKKK